MTKTFSKQFMRLCSKSPGRERWELVGLRRQTYLADQIGADLSQLNGVNRVVASSVTGRILIFFEEKKLKFGLKNHIPETIERIGKKNEEANLAVLKNLKEEKDYKVLYNLIQSVDQKKQSKLKMGGLSVITTIISSYVVPISLALVAQVVLSGPISLLKRFGLKSAYSQLGSFGLMFLCAQVIQFWIEHRASREWKRYATEIEHSLRCKAFGHLERLDMAYIESQKTSQLRSIIHDDTVKIRNFLETIPYTSIDKSMTFFAGAVFLLWVSPIALLLSLIPLPVCLWLFRKVRRNLGKQIMIQVADESNVNHQISNSLTGLATVKSFTSENHELQRLIESSEKLRISTNASGLISSVYGKLTGVSIVTGVTLPLIYTGGLVISGAVTVSVFMFLIFILPKIVASITGLDQDFELYMSSVSASKRLTELMKIQPQVLNGEQSLLLDFVGGNLAFEQVSFGYDPSNLIFQNFDFNIPKNNTIAFVGSTGSGKSTIIKLLLRFYDVNEGQILLDGQDISALDFHDLRKAVGLVSQEVFLFHGTIYENILYGRPDATYKEVVEAARMAEALGFITDCPNGFETIVGERGANFSGGERQRISIARVLLKDPPILILDEATSSVDNETEAAIQHSIDRISKNRTLVIIAHRLSTVRHADCINVVEDGKISEHGTHDELLALNGTYRFLWKLQTEGLEHTSEELQGIVVKDD